MKENAGFSVSPPKILLTACLLAVAVLPFFSASASVAISDNCQIEFVSKKRGGELLAEKDDYIQRLSEFDRTAKLQRKRPASPKKFMAFARKQSLGWTQPERDKLTNIISSLRSAMTPYAQHLPPEIQMVKTTGRLISGAIYTRGNAIFIPELQVERPSDFLSTVMLHQFFHLIVRNNPPLRDRLYAAIGFIKTTELELPESLKERKISHPDVPILTYLIKVKINGEDYWGTPFLYSREPYNPTIKRSFFQYLTLGMLAYQWGGPGSQEPPTPVMVDEKPLLVQMDQVEGLYEQVGRNAPNPPFHPEELLADNFAMLAQGFNVNSPEVLERMKAAFAAWDKKD